MSAVEAGELSFRVRPFSVIYIFSLTLLLYLTFKGKLDEQKGTHHFSTDISLATMIIPIFKNLQRSMAGMAAAGRLVSFVLCNIVC
jgi:hypothetical protein